MVTRKLDGLLQGDYAGLLPGPGSEAGESREYRPGDDVRRMDWPVTARTTTPHVRRTVADRELETWLAVDLSASLDFGTGRWLKRDVVVAAAAAITHLTVRGGNRIGAVIGTGGAQPAAPAGGAAAAPAPGPGTLTAVPARSGRKEAQGLLRAVAGTRRSAPAAVDLGALVEPAQPAAPPAGRGRGDLRLPRAAPQQWARPLRKLAGPPRRAGDRGGRPARAGTARRRGAAGGRPGER